MLAVYVNVVKGISDTKPEMNHQNSFYRHNQRPSLYVPNGTGGRDVLYACVLSTMPFRKMWYLRPNWFAMSMIQAATEDQICSANGVRCTSQQSHCYIDNVYRVWNL